MEFIIKDNSERIDTNKHWQFCVGSGQAKLALRTDYKEQLKKIHDELGIQRVRFHGIFDDSMNAYMGLDDFMPLPGSKNFKNYNFHNIGIAYDNVLAAGMKPWVELSFMPSKLAKKNKKVTVNAEGLSSMPKDEDEWCRFIKEFIKYLLHRYGIEEIITWNFEVWNEPNMSTFFSGTKEDYFRLYEITAKAIKEIDDRLQVGGPATSEGAWIAEFIEYCESKHIPLDFISTHNYPGDGIGEILLGEIIFEAVVGGMKRLKKKGHGTALEGCREMMQDKSEMTEMPKGQMYDNTKKVSDIVAGKYPIYYTEWNCNAILSCESNDTKKVACFQVKSIDEMEENVTGSSIWCFSDIFDEFLLFPDTFSGGFGLLTVDGIPKPQFYALKLLAEVGDKKYKLPRTNDEVEIAVYESKTEKRIFVYRQRMKNVDEANVSYKINLELQSQPEQVCLYRIDDEHCNPMKVWKDMGAPKDLNVSQIQEIVNKSSLQQEHAEYEMNDKMCIIENVLGVNDVHCYVIELE